ncbi:MAG: NADPH-dependent glutamate synthase [Fusobacteriaceae bacterium]|jgi:glutamate synthase (NADPH/NADH) small chain|nr:NADPH-dependent glutamate synthase [Fusobacteriaceae bacterium]
MHIIRKKKILTENIIYMDVEAPDLAKAAQPGQFLIVKAGEEGERVPLTICDYDRKAGTVAIVFQVVGPSTQKMAALNEGDAFADVVGPLGRPSDFLTKPLEELRQERFLFIAGGVGTAPVYPQVKWFKARGLAADVIIGTKNKNTLILWDEMKAVADTVFLCTDDGSAGMHGLVTDMLKKLVAEDKRRYDEVVAIGPMIMMKFATLTARELGLPITVSLNPLMVDGTGMCGACRLTIGGRVKFACVDGPEFDGYAVDFDEAMKRQNMFKTAEGRNMLKAADCGLSHSPACPAEPVENPVFPKGKRVPVREQAPDVRNKNFDEVSYGYNLEEARAEAARCLQCKNPLCVQGCPVAIDIPGFIREIKAGNPAAAGAVLLRYSNIPAICSRVCPQETQCEERCVVGIKGEPVSIGKLERFAGDYLLEHGADYVREPAKGQSVAVIGSGPAGLTCAGDLAKLGYDVTIFEGLHKTGGVLSYGIPEFRLPKNRVVQVEIKNLEKLGVRFVTNTVIGKTLPLDDLFQEKGFSAVFIGTGAGLPKFMGIPGETLNGVISANEFLTRVNLMKANEAAYDTPVVLGKRVAVVGGGNVAMDAARTAKRLGAEVEVLYRRSEKELPARLEEIQHAKEEGVNFQFLVSPVALTGDADNWLTEVKLIRMSLGEPDESGRAKFTEIPGSEFTLPMDTVIMSLGTSPNPLIAATTEGLRTDRWNCIEADGATGQTSREGVFAGGDAVTGAATVILAMEAGKKAAAAIDRYLTEKRRRG